MKKNSNFCVYVEELQTWSDNLHKEYTRFPRKDQPHWDTCLHKWIRGRELVIITFNIAADTPNFIKDTKGLFIYGGELLAHAGGTNKRFVYMELSYTRKNAQVVQGLQTSCY